MENKIIFDLTIKDSELLESLTANAKQSRILRDNIKDLSKNYEANASEIEANKLELKLLGQEQTRVSSLVVRSYNIQSGSIQANRNELSKLKKEILGLANPTADQIKRVKDLTDTLKSQEERLGDFRRSVGDYKNSFKEAFSDIGKDQLMGLTAGSGSVGDALGAVTGMLPGLALIGPAIGNIVDGVSEATTDFIKLRGEIQTLSGVSGDQLDELASKVKGTADTFNKDYTKIILASNAVAKQFAIEQSEALDLINKGFLAGADINGEFLDQLKEYPAQFGEGTKAAEGFIAVLSQNVKDGIFSDKGADVIKEAGIRLREQTKATADALKPLGAEANKAIIQAINSNDTFKAIQLVSKGLNEVTLTASETQTIIADVFGGPGEDAGLEYLKSLQNINLELDSQIDKSNELTIRNLDLLSANEEYAASLNELSKTFEGLNGGSDAFFTRLKTFGLDVINSTVKAFDLLTSSSKSLIGAITGNTDLIAQGALEVAEIRAAEQKKIEKKQEEDEKKRQDEINKRLARQAEIESKQKAAEAEKLRKQQQAEFEKRQKALEDFRQKEIRANKARLELELLQLEEGSEAQLKKREEIILFAAETEKANKEKTEEEKLLIEAKALKDVEKLHGDYLEVRKKESIQLLELARQQAQELIDFEKAARNTDFEIADSTNDDASKKQLLTLTNLLSDEEITRAEFEKRREAAELESLERQLATAEIHGKRTLELEQQLADKKLAIADREKTDRENIEKAKLEALSSITTGAGELVSILAGKSAEAAEFQKGIALVQIATNTAVAISELVKASNGNPLNLLTAGAAGVAQFTAGLAQILTNIAKAKQLLSSPVPQPSFYEGGMFGYTGDGNPREESRQLGNKPYTYHKQELIVPDRVLKTPEGRVLGEKLMLLIKKTSPRYRDLKGFANGGFYVDGGYSVRQASRSLNEQQQISQTQSNQTAQALKNVELVVKVDHINKAQANQKMIKVKSEL